MRAAVYLMVTPLCARVRLQWYRPSSFQSNHRVWLEKKGGFRNNQFLQNWDPALFWALQPSLLIGRKSPSCHSFCCEWRPPKSLVPHPPPLSFSPSGEWTAKISAKRIPAWSSGRFAWLSEIPFQNILGNSECPIKKPLGKRKSVDVQLVLQP